MALKPLKPCAHTGCPALTRSTYCDKHRPKDTKRRSIVAAAWHGWYSLPIWVEDLRPSQLMIEPFCRECTRRARAEGRPELLRVRATDVDHIKPHRGDWERFTDRGNLQSLCHACHSRKTFEEILKNKQKT